VTGSARGWAVLLLATAVRPHCDVPCQSLRLPQALSARLGSRARAHPSPVEASASGATQAGRNGTYHAAKLVRAMRVEARWRADMHGVICVLTGGLLATASGPRGGLPELLMRLARTPVAGVTQDVP
jgi:hypothetical protein